MKKSRAEFAALRRSGPRGTASSPDVFHTWFLGSAASAKALPMM